MQEERIGAAVAALPPEFALGPVAAQTTRFFAGRRTAAARTAEVALDGDRYLALLDAVDALIADPPLTDEAAGAARTVLPALIAKAVRRVRKAYRAAQGCSPGPERDEHLHDMRKAAKRLRYAAEVAKPALGRPAKRLVKKVKAAQELLGEHQDSVVARAVAARARRRGGPRRQRVRLRLAAARRAGARRAGRGRPRRRVAGPAQGGEGRHGLSREW